MSLTVHADLAQGTDEWLAARCGMVTASTVDALLTPGLKVADNATSRGLALTLVSERITGQVEPTAMSADMWRGVEMEPYARDEYARHHSAVTEVGLMVRDDWGYQLGYSPDGLVGDLGQIEIKSRIPKVHLRTILDDEVPADCMGQLQGGLLVSGRAWVDYVSYSPGMPLWVKRVWPDPAWHEAILAAVEAFEVTAAEMAALYRTRTHGLPVTGRPSLDIQIGA